jgi:hypothetical protein
MSTAGYLDSFRVAYCGLTPGLWKLDMDLAIDVSSRERMEYGICARLRGIAICK